MEILEFWINPELVTFTDSSAIVASGNVVYCIDSTGLKWKKKFITTFYRDPYSDVKITALDATEKHVAVGTNFMDGKLYLLSISGKKLWEYQFATIASLGWRPEDVTSVSIGNGFVTASTQFTHNYLYAYTLKRERMFNRKFKDGIQKIFAGDMITVVSDSGVSVLTKDGKVVFSKNCRVKNACECWGKVILCSGAQNFFTDSVVSVPCEFAVACDDYLCMVCGNNLKLVDEDLKEIWNVRLNKNVVHVFCRDGEIFAATNDEVFKVANGDVKSRVKACGRVLGVCGSGMLCHDGTLKLVPL